MKQVNRDRALETLKKLISYPHPQHDLAKVRGFIAEVVKPVLARLPFDEIRLDDRGNLIAVKRGQSAEPPLVICTYGGSYPAENMPDPYTPKIVDGEPYGLNGPCMWGRSTTEQLSGAAAMLEAVTTFFEEKRNLRRDLLWITNYSGEMGNHEAVSYIFLEQKVPLGPTLLVTASDNGICLGNLGRIDVSIRIEGVSCHSSDPSKGKNSIDGLYQVLNKVYTYPYLKTDPDLGKSTLTPTRIKTWPDALHTNPANTQLMLDRRLVAGEDPIQAMSQLREYIGEGPAGLKISYEEKLNFQYPHKADPECDLVRAARKAGQAVLGGVKTFYKRSALDMGFFSHHGQDCFLFGPGNHALAHSDHEMVSIADYQDAAQIYEIILEEMVL
jgi:acetylornithine deacetylase/succinyl-diaminopimelate desuccinylase-like protein